MHLRVLVCVSAILFSAGAARAEEGMWLPAQTPSIASDLKEAGLKLNAAKLGDLSQPPLTAIVSLGGCSAAFLSPEGLIATNHHCVYGSIQYNSSETQDYLTNGFLARTKADEVQAAPGTRAFVIEDLRDVTTSMLTGASTLEGRARYDALERNRKALIQACEALPNRRCEVRDYFGGNTYYLQQQLEIKDVRLVYAPAGGIGNFGGEIDNWQWPRHTGDFGFYRAYVAPDGSSAAYAPENVPFKPKAWLKIASSGVKDGDFVMVAGFPGTTDRHRTASETDFYYNEFYPLQQRLLSDYSEAIMAATRGNAATVIKYASILKGADNYKKKLLGQMAGADSIALRDKKAANEASFREWVGEDPQRKATYGPAIGSLDALIAEETRAALAGQRRALRSRGQLYAAAALAYRWTKERTKPDAEREPGFQDRDRRLVEEALTRIERRFDANVDRQLFENALSEYMNLDPSDRNAGFDEAIAQTSLDRLYKETTLGDTASRLALLDSTADALEASSDPFVQLAVAAYPGEIAAETVAKARSGNLQKARSGYMAARLAYAAANGEKLYPDANGSLRFTYGRVTGRSQDGQRWMAFTTAEGLAAKQTGREPFNAPESAIAAIAARDYGKYKSRALGTLPVNFLSTVDITNGNSGSSTLNARGEFVGLAFDGTLDGVISDWWYDGKTNRTIHVDSRFMLWTMDKIDNAENLLKEMGVSSQSSD